jgi:hypothetical protein
MSAQKEGVVPTTPRHIRPSSSVKSVEETNASLFYTFGR